MKFYKYISVVLFIISIYLAYSLYNFKIDRNEIVSLQESELQKSMQINDLLSERKKMIKENGELRSQIGRIHNKREELILMSSAFSEFEDPVDFLKQNLIQRRDLIPNKELAKGEFNFHDETITILNDKWVFASYEDGYFVGDMLLEYSLVDKENVSWTILSHRID